MAAEEPIYCEVGRRIRVARERAKMTQGDLAEAVSLTRTSLTNIEKGRQRVLLHTLVELAEALKVSPISLLPPPVALPRLSHNDESASDPLRSESPEVREWITSSRDEVHQQQVVRLRVNP